MKGQFFLAVALIVSLSILGQEGFTNIYSVSLMGGLGSVFKTNSMIAGNSSVGIPIVYSNRLGLKVQKRLVKKPWHTNFNYPTIGIQVFKTKFKNGNNQFKDSFGQPMIIAGFFDAPFFERKKMSFGYYLGLGAALGWKPFSQNATNISIGSKKSFYIELGLNLKRALTKKLWLGLNLGLTHYSNGATKLPNFGVNIANTTLSLDYSLGKEVQIKKNDYKSKVDSSVEFDLSFFVASKSTLIKLDTISLNTYEYTLSSYPIIGFSGVVGKDLDRKNKLGVGFTVSHNPTNAVVEREKTLLTFDNEKQKVEAEFLKDLQTSIYLAYELKVGQVSVLIQPSFYLYRGTKVDYIPNFYQRLGIRYNTKKKVFLGFNLRAYDFHVSDFIEWNIGYSF